MCPVCSVQYNRCACCMLMLSMVGVMGISGGYRVSIYGMRLLCAVAKYKTHTHTHTHIHMHGRALGVLLFLVYAWLLLRA